MEAISLDFKSDEFVDFFCNKYKEISHKELKNINEFIEIKDQAIRERIYFKIRYNYLKGNCSIIDNVTYIKRENANDRIFQGKTSEPMSLIKLFICLAIFVFLANESVYFYQQMGIQIIFTYLLPIVLELSVFFLFLKKDILSKIVLGLIIAFNIFTFSTKTIDLDKKSLEIKKIESERKEDLRNFKLRKENNLASLENDLARYRALYADLIKNGYFKKAAESLHPEIIRIEKKIIDSNNTLPILNNAKISTSTLDYNIVKNISMASANLIALKIILLFVFLLFISDLKHIFIKDSSC